jgi:hypothetical protein
MMVGIWGPAGRALWPPSAAGLENRLTVAHCGVARRGRVHPRDPRLRPHPHASGTRGSRALPAPSPPAPDAARPPLPRATNQSGDSGRQGGEYGPGRLPAPGPGQAPPRWGRPGGRQGAVQWEGGGGGAIGSSGRNPVVSLHRAGGRGNIPLTPRVHGQAVRDLVVRANARKCRTPGNWPPLCRSF